MYSNFLLIQKRDEVGEADTRESGGEVRFVNSDT